MKPAGERWRSAARSVLAVAALPPITIGLFLPLKGTDAGLGRDILGGATVAVVAANRDGGIAGRPLRLVTAPSDLPWEAASGSLVRLVYEQDAVAIVGAVDDRSAHLAEQVTARARGETIFVTPWAFESRLTRIRIPWFFRAAPDDRLQAALLAGEIFSTRRVRRAAAWVEDSFDARAAADAFAAVSPPGAVTRFTAAGPDGLASSTAKCGEGEFGAVILHAGAPEAARVASALRRAGCDALLAGTLRLAAREFTSDAAAEGVLLTAPWVADLPAARRFEREFLQVRGAAPTPLAWYSHDAVVALVAAMRRASRTGGPLGPALESTRIDGLTGRVAFDDRRDRSGPLSLAMVRGGRIVPIERTSSGAAAPTASRQEGERR